MKRAANCRVAEWLEKLASPEQEQDHEQEQDLEPDEDTTSSPILPNYHQSLNRTQVHQASSPSQHSAVSQFPSHHLTTTTHHETSPLPDASLIATRRHLRHHHHHLK